MFAVRGMHKHATSHPPAPSSTHHPREGHLAKSSPQRLLRYSSGHFDLYPRAPMKAVSPSCETSKSDPEVRALLSTAVRIFSPWLILALRDRSAGVRRLITKEPLLFNLMGFRKQPGTTTRQLVSEWLRFNFEAVMLKLILKKHE